MARYDKGTNTKYNKTDPIYQTFSKEEVDAGLETGEFVIVERDIKVKLDGRIITEKDRRAMPADKVKEKEVNGWAVVSLSMPERIATAKAPEGGGKKAPAASAKETR